MSTFNHLLKRISDLFPRNPKCINGASKYLPLHLTQTDRDLRMKLDFGLLFERRNKPVNQKMKLYIKYMVSLRCKMMVKEELYKLGLKWVSIDLGVIEIKEDLLPEQ